MKCPSCHKTFERATDDAALPFCSERCKMVDLAKWFGGHYAIAAEHAPERAGVDDQAVPFDQELH